VKSHNFNAVDKFKFRTVNMTRGNWEMKWSYWGPLCIGRNFKCWPQF